MSAPSPHRRRALFGAAVLLVVAGVLVLRVALASHAAYSRGMAAEEARDVDDAALAYREAILWYFPGNPFVTSAIERMWAIADAHEAAGDLVGARIVIGDLRGALYAIRHVTQPHAAEVRMCDRRLAQLLAATDERVVRGNLGLSTVLPTYEAATARDHAPNVGWSLALSLGFVGWLLFTALTLFRLAPATPEGPFAWRRSLPWAALSLASLTLWLLGALLA